MKRIICFNCIINCSTALLSENKICFVYPTRFFCLFLLLEFCQMMWVFCVPKKKIEKKYLSRDYDWKDLTESGKWKIFGFLLFTLFFFAASFLQFFFSAVAFDVIWMFFFWLFVFFLFFVACLTFWCRTVEQKLFWFC